MWWLEVERCMHERRRVCAKRICRKCAHFLCHLCKLILFKLACVANWVRRGQGLAWTLSLWQTGSLLTQWLPLSLATSALAFRHINTNTVPGSHCHSYTVYSTSLHSDTHAVNCHTLGYRHMEGYLKGQVQYNMHSVAFFPTYIDPKWLAKGSLQNRVALLYIATHAQKTLTAK